MAIKLTDCPPSLHAAIMAQLAKEGRKLPTITIAYAVATVADGEWTIGPETSNLKLVQGIVSKLQLRSGRSAYLASIGHPTAVVVKLTHTEPAKEILNDDAN